MHTTVNGQVRFLASLSSWLEKVPWLRLATCLLDFADSRKLIEGRGTMIQFLPSLNSSTEPSRKWKLNLKNRVVVVRSVILQVTKA